MTQLREDLQGRGEVQALSRARIQPMRDGVQLALRVARQVCALRQVLTQQPIGILIGPALPGAVRIGKEHLDGEALGQALVLGHLFTSIIGQRFAQRGRHMPEFFREALVRTRGIRFLHSGQQDQASRPLHQSTDGRAIAGALDEVTFPVAGDGAAGHFCGAIGNRRHVEELPPSIRAARSRAARFARLTECRQQFLTQRSPWQHIQGRVDGFGREVFPHLVRIRASEASDNLLGRAALAQVGPDILPEPRVQEFAWPPRLTRSADRVGLRRAGTIGMAACCVAGIFAAQRAGRPPQDPRQPAQRLPLGQAQTHGLTVFGAQVRIQSLWHGNTLALPGRQCCTWS